MQERLIITNFAHIKQADLAPKRLTLILGNPNEGNLTISLLHFFRSGFSNKKELIRAFKERFGFYTTSDFEMVYRMDEYVVDLKSKAGKTTAIIQGENPSDMKPLYIPSDRYALEWAVPPSCAELVRHTAGFYEASNQTKDLLGIESTSQDLKYYGMRVKTQNGDMLVQQSPNHIKSAYWMCVALDKAIATVPLHICIEEPEAHFDIEGQVAMARYLTAFLSKSSSTLTLTTHSPYFLNAINHHLDAEFIQQHKDLADELDRPTSDLAQGLVPLAVGDVVAYEYVQTQSVDLHVTHRQSVVYKNMARVSVSLRKDDNALYGLRKEIQLKDLEVKIKSNIVYQTMAEIGQGIREVDNDLYGLRLKIDNKL